MSAHPPKPPLALAVGVVGHRPNRLPEAGRVKVAAEVAKVLDGLAREARSAQQRYSDVFTTETPLLAIVSALAEGADRIAAEAALARKFVLDAPLPFAAEIYEADFMTPESRQAFRKLLGQARSVLTLPGSREADSRAYEAVGLTVLSQSDILLAVWDRGPSAGPGGTTDILTSAMRSGVPIIHVDAKGEDPTRVLWSGLRDTQTPIGAIGDLPAAELDEALPRLVDDLIRPPLAAPEAGSLRGYLAERAFGLNWRLEVPFLMALLGVRPVRATDFRPAAPDALAADYVAFATPAKGGDISRTANAYGWADALGVWYAQTFRSAFILNFVFAAVAVVLAATSLLGEKLYFAIPEIVLIIAVLTNTMLGRRRRWHQRWLEAREVAERLRVALPLWALGIRPTTFFSGEEPTWTGWYARAVTRAQGLRSGEFDAAGLTAARSVMLAVLKDQCSYHESNERRMHRLEHRLERIGLIMFLATLAAAGLYVVLALALKMRPMLSEGTHEIIKHWVVALTAGLPALATATYGIRVIGDFEGVSKRSERTQAVLKRLIETDEHGPPDLRVLRARARAAADAMLGDVSSWRLAAESRPLTIPG